jgi:hypothetical protein
MEGRDPTPPPPTPPALSRRRLLLRALSAGGVTGLLLTVGVEVCRVTLGGNIYAVIPGEVYRCRQPTAARLDAYVRLYGIRTVVNLRGCCDTLPSYLEQSREGARLGLSQEDLPFTAGRLPSVITVRHLVEVLDRSERPVLIHCFQGVDRTGMASAMALLLYTDGTLDEALRQLGPRYGHLPLGHTGNIDRFFELYREWLAAKGLTHTRDNFRRWVEHEYCPGEYLASIEILEPTARPIVMRLGEPLAVRARCTNRSVKPWRFRPGSNAGIHLCWMLLDPGDHGRAEGLAGKFHAEIAPGESIELTLALPPVYAAGPYRLRVDMEDVQHGRFHQLGPEPLEVEVEVR